MPTFNFEFEELPLLIVDGFGAGHVSGHAEISYNQSDPSYWRVRRIALDGWRPRTKEEIENSKMPMSSIIFVESPVWLDPDMPLYDMIHCRLECEWQQIVSNAVADQIAEDREAEADNAADYRRDRYPDGVINYD